MKTKAISLVMVILFCCATVAQQKGNPEIRKQKREAHRIAFITHQLNLTSEEAQKFWPVYNQYQLEMQVLKQNFEKTSKNIQKKIEEMTDTEIENRLMSEIDFSQKKLELKKQYYSKFKSVLPVKKIAKLYSAERRFREEMKRKMQLHTKQDKN